MFTGIVEEIGNVESYQRLAAAGCLLFRHRPCSAARNRRQPCHQRHVSHHHRAHDKFVYRRPVAGDVAPHQLSDLRANGEVNLERPLAANGRIGGHFVQGHVDGTGVVLTFHPGGDSLWVTVEAAPQLLRYIVPKGYITVDGVSLTVVEVFPESFTFMLVDYTQQHITLPRKSSGSRVNLEVDILGKYVEKFLGEVRHAARQN